MQMDIDMMMDNHRQGNRRRLVVVTAPFQGHLTPMLQLASILHSNGFSITIAHTLFNSPDPSNYPHFLFLPISDGLSHTASISSQNLISLASTLNTNCLSPLRESLLRMTTENTQHHHHQKIACIIYDVLMYCVDSVAQELNLPTIKIRTNSAANFLAYHNLHRLRNEGYLPLQDEKSRQLMVPELEPLRFKDLPTTFSSPSSDDESSKQLKTALTIKPSLGVIFNTVDCLERPWIDQLRKLYQVPIFPIGPLHSVAQDSCSSILKEDYRCIAWLNEQAPGSVLYVSLGSIVTWDDKELTEMAYGLANSKQHFVWVVRARAIKNVTEWVQSLAEDVRKALEERGCVVTWAPQKDVLAHKAVGGFWSHCGWNSTLESLYEGKPMICQPYFGDQTVNSRLVSHVWKVGVEWSNLIERGEVEKAVRRLMVDHEGKDMWQRAQDMKHEIRQAVREGGSSYNALIQLVEHILSSIH